MEINVCPDLCNCPICEPDGCDGAADDAMDAALVAAKARTELRGALHDRPVAKVPPLSWVGDGGSRTGADREALREAAHCLRRIGRAPVAAPGHPALLVA